MHRSNVGPLGPYAFAGEINLAKPGSKTVLPAVAATPLSGAGGDERCGLVGGRGGRRSALLPPPLVPGPLTFAYAAPTATSLFGYYNGQRTDNAVMAANASEAWAASNKYSRWSMFHGVAGAAAAAASGSSAGWSELVSYYSAALQDWMLIAANNDKAALWIKTHGYVKQRAEGVFAVTSGPTVVPGFQQPLTQYWKGSINDTTLAGSGAVAAELIKQGYTALWTEGFGAGAAPAPPPSPPKPPPPPKPAPTKNYMCFGGVCAETKWPNQTKYVNDSRCNSDCQPIPTPPKPPPAYEIPAQQFGFTEVPNPATGEAVYFFVGLRFGSAPTKNHDFQYWEPLRFDDDGNILPLQWADNFTIAV